MVELLIVVQAVAGSNPVIHLFFTSRSQSLRAHTEQAQLKVSNVNLKLEQLFCDPAMPINSLVL